MKIIISRKGFDSSIGKVASPIFPSGELCSLPIPESSSRGCSTRYADLRYGEHELGELVTDLAHGKIQAEQPTHLDPDLRRDCFVKSTRLPGWRPLFGQAGAAERHLQNVGVNPGDLFLFYGWFRRIVLRNGMYRYVQDAPDLHVLFGWLQIEQRIAPVDCQSSYEGQRQDRTGTRPPPSHPTAPCPYMSAGLPPPTRRDRPLDERESIPDWALYHPHCQPGRASTLNSLYIAADRLKLPGVTNDIPGAGYFPSFHPLLCLTNTEPYVSRRWWRVPEWMYPTPGKTPLTYHANLTAWQRMDGYTLLRTAGRGQEFVLDCDEYPQAVEWAGSIIEDALSH